MRGKAKVSAIARAVAVGLAVSTCLLPPLQASAEQFSAETVPAGLDPLDALARLAEINTFGPRCSVNRATGRRLHRECTNVSDGMGWTADYVYAATPIIVIDGPVFRLRHADGSRYASWDMSFSPAEQRRQWAEAWVVLAQPRAPSDPAGDTAFQAAIATIPANEEGLRRVQVQVEAALRANRNIDAARFYRDALRTSPSWADGHYNLGLLYGDLELYPEAITEMRRYLYLTPNAADARAVQDRIYEWEAAMAAP